MWVSELKPNILAYKLKFITLPKLIAALNNYACSLSPLANVDWSAYPQYNPQLVKWHQWRAPVWKWGPDMAPTVSALLSRPCSGILALCRYSVHVHIMATLNSYIVSSSLFKLLPPPTPPHPLPYICWPNINEFHLKKSSKTGKNQSLSTCQVSCTKANR